MMPGLAPVIGGGTKRLVFAGQNGNSSNLSSYTFTGVGLGPADAHRRVFACVCTRRGSGTVDINSVTIGGESASQLFNASWDGGKNKIGIWQAHVPSGDTGNVVVALSATSDRCTVHTISAYGWTSNLSIQTSGSELSTSSSTSRTATTSGNVDAGAHLLATWFAAQDAQTATWTGDVTKVGSDQANEITSSVALGTDSSGGSTKTATCSWATANGQSGLVLLALT